MSGLEIGLLVLCVILLILFLCACSLWSDETDNSKILDGKLKRSYKETEHWNKKYWEEFNKSIKYRNENQNRNFENLHICVPKMNGKSLMRDLINQQFYYDVLKPILEKPEPKKEFDVNAKDSTLIIQYKEKEDKIFAFKFEGFGSKIDTSKYIDAIDWLGVEVTNINLQGNQLLFRSVVEPIQLFVANEGEYVVSVNGVIAIMNYKEFRNRYETK